MTIHTQPVLGSSRRSARGDRRSRRGFTLVEVTVFTGVILVAVLGMSQAFVSSMKLSDSNRETRLATDAARSMVERLAGVEDFSSLYARFNSIDGDDGALDAPGAGFDVPGLTPHPDDGDGRVGEIVFPTVGAELREDVEDPSLGMPRDLNGDGAVDNADHSADYMLLPVTLRLRWTGSSGERTLEVRTLLSDR